jgi:hypothetical protein
VLKDQPADVRGAVSDGSYLLVIGVTMFAAGLATAVVAPGDPLPLGAAISLGGGVPLFYLTNAIVSLR